jgi:tetratricopeptide (TPR) repeat protein
LEQNQPDYTFLEAWYSLAAAYNQGKGDLESAVNCIRRAPDRLRNRPQLLLALGTVHEMAWHERTENGLRLHDIQPDLRVASNAYEQAWTLGGIAEARLRLARVLGLQERHAEALTLLRNPPPFDEKLLLYLRDLFEGDTLERSGDLDAAERAYQGAARTIPGAHSATFALAHLRYTRGRRASALAEVRRNDVEALNAPVDPWLWYLKGTGRRAAHYLETVRTIVRDN